MNANIKMLKCIHTFDYYREMKKTSFAQNQKIFLKLFPQHLNENAFQLLNEKKTINFFAQICNKILLTQQISLILNQYFHSFNMLNQEFHFFIFVHCFQDK